MQPQRLWKTRGATRLFAFGFAVGRTIPLDHFSWNCLVFIFFDLIGLGSQFGGHDSQALGGGEVETLTGDTDAIIRLAPQKLGSRGRHGTHSFQPI